MKILPTAAASAFTLIELLVASAVSLLLVSLLLTAMQGVSSNYTRTQSAITRQGDAAFALDQIVQDIEGLVVPNIQQGEALKITPEPGPVGTSTNAVWLTLLSTSTDSDNSAPVSFSGATRAISYRLKHQNPMDASTADPAYAIYRSIASAKHTFVHAIAATNAQEDYWAALPPAPAPTPATPTAIGNFLSENVVGFSVRFLRADNSQWTSPGDEIRIGRDGTTINGVTVPGGFTRAEVSITVLSTEGAQRLKDNVLTLEEAISRHGQTSIRQTASF